MKKQIAFYFDNRACIGCKACELACKDKNNLPLGIKWRQVWDYGGGTWILKDGFFEPSGVFTYHVSASCMHCADPACQNACPVDAVQKREDGIVLIDPNRCIGDRSCEEACPYRAPKFDPERNVMTKCTFCEDLLALGEKPACVAICPQRCLDFGNLEELRNKYGKVDAIEPLPDSSFTHPSIVITPHRKSEKSGAGTGKVLTRIEK